MRKRHVEDEASQPRLPSPAPPRTFLLHAALLAALLLLAYVPSWEALRDPLASWIPQGLYSRDALGSRLAAARLAHGRGPDIAGFLGRGAANAVLMEQVGFRAPGGAIYPRFPVATGWMAAPLFLGAMPEGREPASPAEAVLRGLPQRELYAASLFTALACVLFLALLRRLPELRDRPRFAWLATAALGLSTPLFASNSQALWSHTGSTLWICAFLLAVWGRPLVDARRAALAGAALGMAAWCRPSHLATLAIAGALIAVDLARARASHGDNAGDRPTPFVVPRAAAAFGLAAGAVLLLAAAINVSIYGEPLGPYIRQLLRLGVGATGTGGDEGARNGFLDAAVGSLIAPNAGLFAFCPVLLLALGGLRPLWRDQPLWGRWLVLTVLAQWLAIARNPFWWGGWCWGPRLFADVVPLLWLASIGPALQFLEGRRAYLLVAAVAVGVFLQGLGAYSYRYAWHLFGPDLADQPLRLWNINDGIVRVTLRDGKPPSGSMPWPSGGDLAPVPGNPAHRRYDVGRPGFVGYGPPLQVFVADPGAYLGGYLRGATAWFLEPRLAEMLPLDAPEFRDALLLIEHDDDVAPALIGVRLPPRPRVRATDVLDEIVVAPLPEFSVLNE